MAQVKDIPFEDRELGETTEKEIHDSNLQNLSVLELLNTNYTFRKLSAVQKRHLESLAEGPVLYGPSERLWRSGAAVEKAFIVVAGTVSFSPKRRNAGSVSWRGEVSLVAGMIQCDVDVFLVPHILLDVHAATSLKVQEKPEDQLENRCVLMRLRLSKSW